MVHPFRTAQHPSMSFSILRGSMSTPGSVNLSCLKMCEKKQHPWESLLVSTSIRKEKKINPAKKKVAFFTDHLLSHLRRCHIWWWHHRASFMRFTGICLAQSWTPHSVCHWTSGTGEWTRWLPAPLLWSCAFSSGRSAPGGRWWRRPWVCRACPATP